MQLSNSRILFSIKSFAAAMLALYIAFSIDLERPFWALISVYIVSQPLAGAVRSKTIYRIIGSFIGASATVAFVPNFVNQPILLSVVLSLWVSACLYLSVLDRTPRSYAFLLAGYTVSIIGFPSVNDPNNIFYVSLARFEEITLGIVCATIIHSLVFPHSVSSAFLQQLGAWWDNAKKLLQQIQLKKSQRKFIFTWQKMASEISQLYILSRHLDYDTQIIGDDSVILALDQRMVSLLALFYVIENTIHVEKSSDISQLTTEKIGTILAEEKDSHQQAPEIFAHSSWHDILKWSLYSNLNKLTSAYNDFLQIQAYLHSQEQEEPLPADLLSSEQTERPLHKYYRNAIRSGIATFIAIMTVSIFWILSAWPDGGTAAQLAAIACCFFASQLNPGIFVVRFIMIVILVIPIAAFYLFAVLTRVDGFFMLTVVLAPYYLLTGYLVATPRFSGAGIAAILAFANLVLLQDRYNFEFASYINTSIALVFGMSTAAIFNYIYRAPKERKHTKNLLASIQTDLARITSGYENNNNFIYRTEDRLGLFAPVLMHSSKKYKYLKQGLKRLSIGMNIINLEKSIAQLPVNATTPISDILNHLTTFFHSREINKFPSEFLQQIDIALSKVTALATTAARDNALLGLCGLRLDLFPDAPPYQPVTDEKRL